MRSLLNKTSVTFIVFWAMLGLLVLASTIQGLVLAFKASFFLGIVVLLVEPAPLLVGLVYWFFGVDLCQMFIERLSTL